MPSDTQVIYLMMRVGKIYPPKQAGTSGYLAGVLGSIEDLHSGFDCSGKLSLLSIMAGGDQDYTVEVSPDKKPLNHHCDPEVLV